MSIDCAYLQLQVRLLAEAVQDTSAKLYRLGDHQNQILLRFERT